MGDGFFCKRGEGAGLGGRGGVAKENIDQVAEAAAAITLDCVGAGFCFTKGEGAGLGGPLPVAANKNYIANSNPAGK